MSEPEEGAGRENEEGAADLELFREPEDGSEDTDAPGEVPPPGFRPEPKPRRIIAVSGAKGGVGKSLLATNLALYLATIGRRVVVVDADAAGANDHTFLGIRLPPEPVRAEQAAGRPGPSSEQGAGSSFVPLETPIPGLRLLHGGLDEPVPGASRRTRRKDLLERLESLDAEYIVIDLGAGTHPSLLDVWLEADVSLFVSLPEPTAIENTYRFVRSAFARHLQQRAPDAESRRRLSGVLRRMGHAPAPLDLARRLEADADPLSSFVRESMDSFVFRMVLNQTRLRADLELGDRMRSAARRRLGVHIDYLGYIDYDDTAWSCVRMRRPLLVESPGTKASRSIEKVARRLLAIDAGKTPARSLRTVPPETHHDLLEVDRGATEEEIRRAFKRAKDVYASDALCCYGLFAEPGLEALRARLDEAYDVLLDPARRRPYELSVFPPEPAPAAPDPDESDRSQPAPPPPVITPETEFTGGLLRAVRESQRAALRDISHRTKIGQAYLRAIEEDDFAKLPPAVYVRGFVTELAKCLRLDPDQVARTYTRRYRRYLEEQGHE